MDSADQSLAVLRIQLDGTEHVDAEVAQARGLQEFFGGH